MKILHTADWHFGQTFLQKSRKEEHQLFVQWLLKTIADERIDAVIVAGDIFDVSNPAIEAMDLYHDFLVAAHKLHVHVVIIGGNHDSASRLNTTQSILKFLNIDVVGGELHALGRVIPLKNSTTHAVEAAVVAIPYLRDGDVRKITEGEDITDAQSKFALAVRKHYDTLLSEAQSSYPGLPILGTAHLYVTGSSLSDPSKENMHAIGTLGQISSSCFAEGFSYIALGHIHKPQILNHPSYVPVKYAGSPIPLSFSERNDSKEVSILEFNNHTLSTSILPIPLTRAIVRFKGSADEILKNIKDFTPPESATLDTWIEIIITEKVNFNSFNDEINSLCLDKNIEILSRQIDIQRKEYNNVRDVFIAGLDNNPLDNVEDIFKLKCQKEGINEEGINELIPLFEEILQSKSVK